MIGLAIAYIHQLENDMNEQNARMPNKGATKHSDTDSGSKGANHGASGGLKKSSEMRADVTKPVTTTNRYPKGMA